MLSDKRPHGLDTDRKITQHMKTPPTSSGSEAPSFRNVFNPKGATSIIALVNMHVYLLLAANHGKQRPSTNHPTIQPTNQRTNQRCTGNRQQGGELSGLWCKNHVNSTAGDMRERHRASARTGPRTGESTTAVNERTKSNARLNNNLCVRNPDNGGR